MIGDSKDDSLVLVPPECCKVDHRTMVRCYIRFCNDEPEMLYGVGAPRGPHDDGVPETHRRCRILNGLQNRVGKNVRFDLALNLRYLIGSLSDRRQNIAN